MLPAPFQAIPPSCSPGPRLTPPCSSPFTSFDTVKVRLQTTSPSRFSGPLDVLRRTVRSEGPGALYKGASPPLAAWAATDAIMLGSLTLYRRLLHQSPPYVAWDRLPPHAHGLAGIAAGWTVSLVAAPVEHIKSRLQLQYAEGTGRPRLYSGPLDCIKKIVCTPWTEANCVCVCVCVPC